MLKFEQAQEALKRLLSMFESGSFPAAAARTLIPPQAGFEKPSDKWSLGNKLIMFLYGTEDARGLRQWESVGRRVKKGARAFYILAPCTKKVTKTVVDTETGEEKVEERVVCIGFKSVPVFRYEDTEGADLPKPDYKPLQLPPLHKVADRFGVQVKYDAWKGLPFLGYYHPSRREIRVYSHDLDVWFHELGHAVHDALGKMRGRCKEERELVAELFSATMCELYGVAGHHQQAWEYIKYYSNQDPACALKAVFRVLADVEECLKAVLDPATEVGEEMTVQSYPALPRETAYAMLEVRRAGSGSYLNA